MEEIYIVFDLETTGFNPYSNEIIEIGAIKYRKGEEIEKFHTYVRPDNVIPYRITELTGITNEDVIRAPQIHTALQMFQEFIQEDVIVAHNASFDMGFLKAKGDECNIFIENKVIDTLPLARRCLKELANHKLETIKMHFNINRRSHTAIDDCYTTGILFDFCQRDLYAG